jgi:phage terminase large subunit-like protein
VTVKDKKPKSTKKLVKKRRAVDRLERLESKIQVPASPQIIVNNDIPDFSVPFDLSCIDWEDRIATRSSLMPSGLLAKLDQTRSAKARAVYGRLHIPDITGTPTFEEAGGEWFNEFVCAVFGSWNGIQRAINEFFLLVPKKNSKTTNSAGIMVTAMIRSERPRSELLLVAPTQAVSSIAFSQAVGMIEADPVLLEMCYIQEYVKKITFLPTKCTLQIKSFDPSVLTGIKPTGVLVDELHVIAEHSNADRVMGQIRGGIVSQPEGFMITITTQSERTPKGVFRAELMKARKIRDGEVKGIRMLPILYEFPDDIGKSDQGIWRDPKYWDMVTPNAGRSISIPRLQEEFQKADLAGEEELRRWASQHLNIEIGLALRSDHWMGGKAWLQNGIALTLEELIARSEVITIGIDGGGLDDMLGLTVCGRETETGMWLTWSKAWVHRLTASRKQAEQPIYEDLVRAGDLVIVEHMGEDMDQLGDIAEQVVKSEKLWKVGLDPSGIGQILDRLEEVGIKNGGEGSADPKQIVGVSQGWRLNAAIKTTERKLAENKLKHASQPLMGWCVENARVEPRGNAILITKQVSGNGKIDPLMALFNAVELMSMNPPAASKQYQMMIIGD